MDRSLPAEISEFLVNALKSHGDDEVVWERKGRLERERKDGQRGGETGSVRRFHVRLRLCVEKKKRKKKKEGESGRAGV